MVQPLWKTSMAGPQEKKIKSGITVDSVIPLLGIHQKKVKAGSQRDSCTPMFIAVLITVAKK